MNGTIDKIILNAAKKDKEGVQKFVYRELDERAKAIIDVKKIELASKIYDKNKG